MQELLATGAGGGRDRKKKEKLGDARTCMQVKLSSRLDDPETEVKKDGKGEGGKVLGREWEGDCGRHIQSAEKLGNRRNHPWRPTALK